MLYAVYVATDFVKNLFTFYQLTHECRELVDELDAAKKPSIKCEHYQGSNSLSIKCLRDFVELAINGLLSKGLDMFSKKYDAAASSGPG